MRWCKKCKLLKKYNFQIYTFYLYYLQNRLLKNSRAWHSFVKASCARPLSWLYCGWTSLSGCNLKNILRDPRTAVSTFTVFRSSIPSNSKHLRLVSGGPRRSIRSSSLISSTAVNALPLAPLLLPVGAGLKVLLETGVAGATGLILSMALTLTPTPEAFLGLGASMGDFRGLATGLGRFGTSPLARKSINSS